MPVMFIYKYDVTDDRQKSINYKIFMRNSWFIKWMLFFDEYIYLKRKVKGK